MALKKHPLTAQNESVADRLRRLVTTLKQGECYLVEEVAVEWGVPRDTLMMAAKRQGVTELRSGIGGMVRLRSVIINPAAKPKKGGA